TDGAFWASAVGRDMAGKLVGGAEGHGEPPGFYLLTLSLLIFPFCLLLPAAAVNAWRERATPWVRFALCWLIPSWLVFEAAPTKLVHYPLPLYAALFWLLAAGMAQPLPRWARWTGAALLALCALGLAALGLTQAARIGTPLAGP